MKSSKRKKITKVKSAGAFTPQAKALWEVPTTKQQAFDDYQVKGQIKNMTNEQNLWMQNYKNTCVKSEALLKIKRQRLEDKQKLQAAQKLAIKLNEEKRVDIKVAQQDREARLRIARAKSQATKRAGVHEHKLQTILNRARKSEPSLNPQNDGASKRRPRELTPLRFKVENRLMNTYGTKLEMPSKKRSKPRKSQDLDKR